MRRLIFVFCFLSVALLSLHSTALAQRGQGSGQGQSTAKPPAANPAKPPTSSAKPPDAGPEKAQSGTQGSKGQAQKAEKAAKGATEALHKNPRLAESMSELLPGQDLDAASSGFRNLGQFVAAAQASKNTGVPFNELKTRMVDRDMSLGQALKDARPALDGPAEAQKAEKAARDRVSKAEQGR